MTRGSQADAGIVVAAAVGKVAIELQTVGGEREKRSWEVGQYNRR